MKHICCIHELKKNNNTQTSADAHLYSFSLFLRSHSLVTDGGVRQMLSWRVTRQRAAALQWPASKHSEALALTQLIVFLPPPTALSSRRLALRNLPEPLCRHGINYHTAQQKPPTAVSYAQMAWLTCILVHTRRRARTHTESFLTGVLCRRVREPRGTNNQMNTSRDEC